MATQETAEMMTNNKALSIDEEICRLFSLLSGAEKQEAICKAMQIVAGRE